MVTFDSRKLMALIPFIYFRTKNYCQKQLSCSEILILNRNFKQVTAWRDCQFNLKEAPKKEASNQRLREH